MMGTAALRRRALSLAVVVLLALVAGGCRPLYLPPVPASEPVPPVARLGDASSLRLESGTLTLHVILAEVPREGWLAVQWFAPDDTEAASDSVWIAPADVGQGRTLRLPQRVTLTAGEWRAIVSLRGSVLRQFRVDVPASAVPSSPP